MHLISWVVFLQGVAQLEANGFVHMDLTHSNVLLVNGRACIGDFGISVRLSKDESGALLYTHDATSKLLIHPFAVAPDVLKQYYHAVDVLDAEGPQHIDMRGQGVIRVLD